MAVHHTFKTGTKVLIILRDGTKIIDRFVQSKGHYIYFREHKFKWEEIRSTSIYR